MWLKIVGCCLFLLVLIAAVADLSANVERLRAWRGMQHMNDELAAMKARLVRVCWTDAAAIVIGTAGVAAIVLSLF